MWNELLLVPGSIVLVFVTGAVGLSAINATPRASLNKESAGLSAQPLAQKFNETLRLRRWYGNIGANPKIKQAANDVMYQR